MSSLSLVAAQILDKIVETVTGPVRGTITSTATSDIFVPIGTRATLPDGRYVRVIKRTLVGTGGAAIPVRLEHLSPSFPAVGNFRPVALGTVATWVSPPAGLSATGTTSAFASGVNAGTLKLGAIVEHDSAETPPDIFAAGAAAPTTALVLVSPTCKRIGPDNITSRGLYEATWRLRMIFADVGEQKERRTRARDAFDAIVNSAAGGAAGEDVIRIGGWSPARVQAWGTFWEAPILTRVALDGRPMIDAAAEEAFEGIDLTVELPEDADQPSPFRVLDTADT